MHCHALVQDVCALYKFTCVLSMRSEELSSDLAEGKDTGVIKYKHG